MNRLAIVGVAVAVLLLGGCSMFHKQMPPPAASAAPMAAADASPGVETIPFRTGVSSATKMANGRIS